MYTRIDLYDLRSRYLWEIKAPIPGYMHDNVTITAANDYRTYTGHPTSWDDESVTFLVNYYGRQYYTEITVTGENLESKNVFKEPIQVILYGGTDVGPGRVRNVQEDYSSPVNMTRTYNFTGTTYYVQNPNVKKLKVTTNPDGIYIPGWFINPTGTCNNVTALYGSNSYPAIKVNNESYGIGLRIKGYNSVGFEIAGTNIQGFSNFKGYSLLPWTWKDQY